MPTSDMNLIPAVLDAVRGINPKRTVDCGIGMGKYGALMREVLDYTYGRFQPSDWLYTIDGIEGWEAYRCPNWGHYNSVKVADFTTVPISGYDLVLAVDSLEHLPMEQGRAFLDNAKTLNQRLLISTPAPVYYLQQGACFGNPLEVHRHQWTPQEFRELGGTLLYTGICQLFVF